MIAADFHGSHSGISMQGKHEEYHGVAEQKQTICLGVNEEIGSTSVGMHTASRDMRPAYQATGDGAEAKEAH